MNSQTQSAPKLNPAITTAATATGVRHVFKLGLDVDLHFVVTATQCDHGVIKPAQKLTRAQLIPWVKERIAAGHASPLLDNPHRRRSAQLGDLARDTVLQKCILKCTERDESKKPGRDNV